VTRSSQTRKPVPRSPLVSSSRALVLRAAAVLVIVIGYADLVRGGTVLAPLALVIGYLVVVPLSFLVE
jgi:hypothetical protein